MLKIKKDDEVVVISGRDKGRRGEVQRVLKDGRLIVGGINMVKKHQRPNPNVGDRGGIVDQEAPIQASNVAIWNHEDERADRVGFREEDGKKVRVFQVQRQGNRGLNMSDLYAKYQQEIRPKLQADLGLDNIMQVPRIRESDAEHGGWRIHQ